MNKQELERMVAEILQTMQPEPQVKGSDYKPRDPGPQPEQTQFEAGDFVEDVTALDLRQLYLVENAKNADAMIASENDRVEEARKAATAKIEELEEQLRSCLQALDRIKEANRPAPVVAANASAFDFDRSEKPADSTDSVVDEIAANLEALVGTADEPAPKAEPRHPVADTTSKFVNLQFGRNYDPNHK